MNVAGEGGGRTRTRMDDGFGFGFGFGFGLGVSMGASWKVLLRVCLFGLASLDFH